MRDQAGLKKEIESIFNEMFDQLALHPEIEVEFDWLIENGFVPGAVFFMPYKRSYMYVKSYSINTFKACVSVAFKMQNIDIKIHISIPSLKKYIKNREMLKSDGTPIELKEN